MQWRIEGRGWVDSKTAEKDAENVMMGARKAKRMGVELRVQVKGWLVWKCI